MTNFNGLKTWLKEHKITEVECIVSDLTGIARGKKLCLRLSFVMTRAFVCQKVFWSPLLRGLSRRLQYDRSS